jgi:hypothetical protein
MMEFFLQLMGTFAYVSLTVCGERMASEDHHEEQNQCCCLLASHLAAGSIAGHV